MDFGTIVISRATFCVVAAYNNVLVRFRRTGGSQIETSMDPGADFIRTSGHGMLLNISMSLPAGGIPAYSHSLEEPSPTLVEWIVSPDYFVVQSCT